MPTRTGSNALIDEDVASDIIKGVTNKSAAMQLMRHVQMKQQQKRLPIIEVLPDGSDFLATDTSLKPVAEMSWTNKYLDARPIACIVYLPEDVVDDVMDGGKGDIWEQVKPQMEDDIARKLDNAIFFGVGKPAVWPTAIATAAIAAGNTVTLGAGVDIFADINTAMTLIEADGYSVDGFWARQQFKGNIRNERDANRGFLYPPSGPANTGASEATVGGSLFGEKLVFSRAGLSGFANLTGNPHLIAADWSQMLLGIRKDLQWKVLDQATLYNTDGSVRIALPQQDAVAIRVVGRFAFQVPNPVNRMQGTESARYPAAVVRQT
ncbi:MAG TPA: phage major capsid protein [Chloroflexota bacterium]|nr:phage major capsid protein [Chloroflexota bacterium]